MTMERNRWMIGLVALVAVTSIVTAADQQNWLAAAGDIEQQESDRVEKVVAEESAEGFQKAIPLTIGIDYTLASKYMWRGQDLTPDHNRMNHQMTVAAEYDLGAFGAIGGSVWFQWNGGYQYGSENHDGSLQEVDYTVYWGYTIDCIGLSTEVGFIWYQFPHAEAANTQEIYMSLGWDDGILWKAVGLGDSAILNPTFSLYFDVDEAKDLADSGCPVWGEFGFSHDFALADYGLKCTPILKDLTFGLNWMTGWATNYAWTDFYSGPMTMQFGATLNLDLKSVFQIPDQYCGDLYLTGFLNYNLALTNNAGQIGDPAPNSAGVSDNLWGGMSIGYAW